MSGLPDIYALGPQARGLRVYISGKPLVPMVYLLCNTSVHKPCKGERKATQTLFINDVAIFIFPPVAFSFGFEM